MFGLRPRVALGCRWIALLTFLAAGQVQGANQVVRFEVGLPAQAETRGLRWGLLGHGLELAQGRQAPAAIREAARAGPLVFSSTMPAWTDAAAPPVAWLCLNQDQWESYAPSFGDRYQTVTAEPTADGWLIRAPAAAWQEHRPPSPEAVLTVHYHRFANDLLNTTLWTWTEHDRPGPTDNELLPVGQDEFGLVFQVNTAAYGSPGDRIGLLPRRNRDWNQKDNGDRYWSPDMGREVYLVQGSDRVDTKVPNVSPQVQSVTLDADRHVTLKFNQPVPKGDWTTEKIKLTTDAGGEVPLEAVYPFNDPGDYTATFSIAAVDDLDFIEHGYVLTLPGYGQVPVRVGHVLRGSQRFYDPAAVLGATYTPQKTTFRVFAPSARTAQVVVADAVEGSAGVQEHALTRGSRGVWEAVVPGDLAGKFYAYRLGGAGFDSTEELTDIYATCTQGRKTRTLIVDLGRTDPPGFREQRWTGPASPVDAIIYEMHVRDFTIAANSGVTTRGKYLGLSESGTHLPDDPQVRTGLEHLAELGVTHVQIMPVQDFFNAEDGSDRYDWGYMPFNFNSPEGWYAGSTAGPARITELKTAIKALHDRGIGVIMDVVYNHVAGESAFDRLVPGYYFRYADNGELANGSGCGNEFCSENPMARKFIIDSVKYWVREYQVDGFRFDLMGLIDLETMKQLRTELKRLHPNILVYGEPWAAGPTPLKPITDKALIRGTGLAAFNDNFRDAIKGDRDGGAPGFIQCGDRAGNVAKGLEGAIHDWSSRPLDALSYFEAHDNLTAWDKLLQSVPQGSDADRRRMMRLAALILCSSQGITFMHSGQEFCRTKQGSHNSYNQPDTVNQIDWSWKKTYADVWAYHRGMIALRKAHPVLRLRTQKDVRQRVTLPPAPNERCIVYRLEGSGLAGEQAAVILVLLNGSTGVVEFPLPEGEWTIYADADRAGVEARGALSGKAVVPANSGMFLTR